MTTSEFPGADAERTYSLRLVRPYFKVLSEHPAFPSESFGFLDAMDPDDRVSAFVVHQALEHALLATGDPNLGLRAAREYAAGDAGAIDYLVHSAPTVRKALESIGRYGRLVSDVLDFYVETDGKRMTARIENRISLPRAAADFQLAILHRVLATVWQWGNVTGLVVYSEHPEPKSRTEYELTFSPVEVVFGAPFSGFSFDESCAENSLAAADLRLHAVIRRHADGLLERLPRPDRFTEHVRDIVESELSGGDPGIANVARRLRISERTLERRLDREGTSFTELLGNIRNALAISYLETRELRLSEIATRLGFSEQSAFQRAFKRWTGQTPLRFRRGRRPTSK